MSDASKDTMLPPVGSSRANRAKRRLAAGGVATVIAEHLDVAFIAPNDLAQAMGLQGQPDHPDVVAAIEDGLACIAGAGGAVPGTFCQGDSAPRLIEAGARFLYASYDAWLAESGRTWLSEVRRVEGQS
jgi:4-hydroxy-2-oxoheptanedioate aldolase